ncbi:unnamed protein product [Brassica rapa subsp. trilocularis]
MASDQIMHVQPEVLDIDETNNYLNGQLLKLCAGPLFDTPKVGEKVYYFPQGHIEQAIFYLSSFTSINDELCQLKPIFDIPSKICCNVFSINLKVENNTNDIYERLLCCLIHLMLNFLFLKMKTTYKTLTISPRC